MLEWAFTHPHKTYIYHMTITVTAVGERVLVSPLTMGDELSHSKGGIILPEEATNKKLNRGVVVSIGARVSEEIRVGDMVAYSAHSACAISGLGDDRVVVFESDIQVVIRNGK